MDKEEFNKLGIEDQVREFNKLVASEGSIRKACDKLSIGKTTIRDRFKKHGYVFKGNGYIKDTNTQSEGQTSLIEPVEANKGYDITELEQIVNKLIDKRLNELQQVKKTGMELSSECEGDVKYRSYGVYKTISDKFDKYAEKHNRFSKVELISQALILLMDSFE